MKKKQLIFAIAVSLLSTATLADDDDKDCPVTYDQLTTALSNAVAAGNGQFPLDMWATVVNKNGRVCQVTKTGAELNHQWLASRAISAQKAYTSVSLSNNSNSLVGTSVSFTSAGLYLASVPGGPLYGLQHSNPVDTESAYDGKSKKFGTKKDPMRGRYVGGLNVFGGGLALFDAAGKVIGGVGVSGNTSCADHNIAWRVRGEFAALGIAQGALFEFGIDYEGGYPNCGNDVDISGVDDVWEAIGQNTDGSVIYNPGTHINQLF